MPLASELPSEETRLWNQGLVIEFVFWHPFAGVNKVSARKTGWIGCNGSLTGILEGWRLIRLKVEYNRVHTIPFSGRLRTIVEYMSQVWITTSAQYFNTLHAVWGIPRVRHTILPVGCKKTGPSTHTGKLCIWTEKHVPTNRAIICPLSCSIPEFACEGPLCSFFTRNPIDFVWQDFLPLRIGYVQCQRIGTRIVWIFCLHRYWRLNVGNWK